MKEYIVKVTDVGKHAFTGFRSRCKECGTIITDFPFEPLGRVLKNDVGKKCRKINNRWYVENQEQFEKGLVKVYKEDLMRVFEHPNTSAGWKCPICKTDADKEVVLIGVAGTEEGHIMQAEQIHLDCIELRLVKGDKKTFLAQEII